ncbi:MAG: T9SS type A sorting domain-containing protein, partial [Aliifodinibius sp.]|nr:T9SS type A sorting domain-containing protein [Fodinibius sp.]NIV12172.1 T9SS type A sorting domain-containing protein [Fodinibius sp.]NIY25832.1 T9SS type A sorting domain-containing protein [Fodinibius sp.]
MMILQSIYRLIIPQLLLVSGFLFSQQFTVEWQFETLNRAIYVGDIDGDGIGEFVDNTFQDDIKFFDAQTRQIKYTVSNTGQNITIEETSIDLVSYNNSFPFIDYNNNGVSDFIFADQSSPTNPVYRVIDPSTGAIIFEFPQNGVYQFGWLGDFDNDGTLELSVSYYLGTGSTQNVIYSTNVTLTSVKDGEKYLPANFQLSQNYPNPFNPSTTIEYSVRQAGKVQLNIYNSLGQLVKRLVNDQKQAGRYVVKWDGLDDSGKRVPSGAYVYRIRIGEF